MKIAIPVKDENLTFFSNAGHTPKFAIYELTGTGFVAGSVLSGNGVLAKVEDSYEILKPVATV